MPRLPHLALATSALLAACGGGAASTVAATPAPAPAPAPSAAAPEAAATAAQDASPPSIGHRHDKVGNGWFLSGSGKRSYEAVFEPGAAPDVVLRPTADPHGAWVTLMKNVAAAPYAGRRVRVRIGVKTEGVTGRGEVWARATAPGDPEDAPSTTAPLDPTSPMKTYEITIDVKSGARVIEYGASIVGDGRLWVGQDAIAVVP